MRTVGIGVLMQDTGEKARALQHWSDLGILRAEPDTDKQGRGRHREYRAEPFHGERKWALVACALNSLRIPLGEIRNIIEVLRRWGEPRPDDGEAETIALQKFEASTFHAALTGRGAVFLLVGNSIRDGRQSVDICALPRVTSQMLNPDPNTLYDDASAVLIGMIGRFMAEHRAAHILNLTDVLSPLRGKSA